MAYAHGVTREDVFTVATEIFSTGKNPTQASVRARLGKGSFSTISKHLAEWRSQQTDAESGLTGNVEMPEDMAILLMRTYSAIRANTEASIASEQIELLERENDSLRESLLNLGAITSELAGLKFAYQDAMTRLDHLTRENERLAQEVAKPKVFGNSNGKVDTHSTHDTHSTDEAVKPKRSRKTKNPIVGEQVELLDNDTHSTHSTD